MQHPFYDNFFFLADALKNFAYPLKRFGLAIRKIFKTILTL